MQVDRMSKSASNIGSFLSPWDLVQTAKDWKDSHTPSSRVCGLQSRELGDVKDIVSVFVILIGKIKVSVSTISAAVR